MGLGVDEVAHGAQVCGVFGQRCGDGRFESLRAVRVEQLHEPPGEHAHMYAALGRAQEQRRCAGCGVMQVVLRAMRTRGTLASDEGLDVRRIFDLRAAIEAARGSGEQFGGIEEADGIEGGEGVGRVGRVGSRVRVRFTWV